MLAHSSMIICEKWLLLNDKLSQALVKHPAVVKVQTTTRNLYMNFSDGKTNSRFIKLQIGLMVSLIFFATCVFAYIRNISPKCNTLIRRSVISSQAAFEFAQTKTDSLVDRTISSMAATKVLVLPVPLKEMQ